MPHLGILGHEITHQLKRKHPDLYKKLEEHLEVGQEEFNKFKSNLVMNVKEASSKEDYSNKAQEELIAMFVGEHFNNKSFWNKVYVSDKKYFDTLIKLVDRVL